MSDTTPAPDADIADIGFEPDDIPTGFLFKLVAALTVAIVLMVAGTYFYFKHTVANELAAKGYDVEERADWETR